MALLAIVFLYIFGWRVYQQIDIIQIISSAFAIVAIIHYRHPVVRAAKPVATLFVAGLGYAAAVFVARGFTDPLPLLRFARGLLTFVGGVGIAVMFERRYAGAAAARLLVSSMVAVLLHGALMVVMYLSHPLRTLVYGLTGGVQFANRGVFLGVNAADVGIRVMGLTYGLASTSVLQITAAFQLPNLAQNTRRSWVAAPLLLVLLISSAAIAGRSGLLLMALLAPIFIICLFMLRQYRRMATGITLLTLVLLPMLMLAFSALSASRSQQATYTLAHLQELVTVVVAPERSGTLKFLSGQFLLPTSPQDLLFGVGSFGRSASFYLASDVGFVQQLFAYGLFGLVLLWSPLLLMAVIAIRRRAGSPLGALGFGVTVLASLLFNGKEESLYERCYWSFQSLLWLHVILAGYSRQARAGGETT